MRTFPWTMLLLAGCTIGVDKDRDNAPGSYKSAEVRPIGLQEKPKTEYREEKPAPAAFDESKYRVDVDFFEKNIREDYVLTNREGAWVFGSDGVLIDVADRKPSGQIDIRPELYPAFEGLDMATSIRVHTSPEIPGPGSFSQQACLKKSLTHTHVTPGEILAEKGVWRYDTPAGSADEKSIDGQVSIFYNQFTRGRITQDQYIEALRKHGYMIEFVPNNR